MKELSLRNLSLKEKTENNLLIFESFISKDLGYYLFHILCIMRNYIVLNK